MRDAARAKRQQAADKAYKNRARSEERATRDEDIAVLDFETDPFDNTTGAVVFPFLAVLHSKQFPTIVIWEEDHEAFLSKVLQTIETLPRAFTIYAHNGGKFDYLFFVHKLRSSVMFKGRGIMRCKIGSHELRDSMHIIPEALRGYKKDDFDYAILTKDKRNVGKNRQLITDYCIHDCEYLLDIVLAFIVRFGRKLSIGQAAQEKVKSTGYKVGKLNDNFDASLRPYYFGGRVECLAGVGHFVSISEKPYRLYDVNSMYPDAMVRYKHPTGGPDTFCVRNGAPGPHTFFVHLTCRNYGALVCRNEEDGSTSAMKRDGEFFTTIHEYRAAIELRLISNVKIIEVVDCLQSTSFPDFVLPLYAERQETKRRLEKMREDKLDHTDEYFDVKKDDTFLKLILNNSYGKFAQNPRRFWETYFTDHDKRPEIDPESWGALPAVENPEMGYDIWQRRPSRMSFNNVATAASITGGARATLLRGIYAAVMAGGTPIYCDTDSIICTDMASAKLSETELGAWKVEETFQEVIIAGKKLYAARNMAGKLKVRMKGAGGAEWQDFDRMLHGETFRSTLKGPTMTRTGSYHYMTRSVRATGPTIGNIDLLTKGKRRA